MDNNNERKAPVAPRQLAENDGGARAPRKHRSQEFDDKKDSETDESYDDEDDSEEYDSEEDDTVNSPPVKPRNTSQEKRNDQKKAVVPSLKINKIKADVIDGYKSRSARPAFYNQQLLATETSDMTTK